MHRQSSASLLPLTRIRAKTIYTPFDLYTSVQCTILADAMGSVGINALNVGERCIYNWLRLRGKDQRIKHLAYGMYNLSDSVAREFRRRLRCFPKLPPKATIQSISSDYKGAQPLHSTRSSTSEVK